MRSRQIIMGFVAPGFGAAVALAGRVGAQSTWPTAAPVFVSADRIRSPLDTKDTRRNQAPVAGELSPADLTALQRAIARLPRFPAYLYSGCDDRAHAAYRLLPEALRAKAAKIWVFSPARYTPALEGTLGLRTQGAGAAAPPVSWGYHVALAFRRGDGLLVYDAVLAPDRVLARDAWFGLLTIPTASIWTLLPGSGYSFNGVDVGANIIPEGRSPNRYPLNGHVYNDSLSTARIPQNLARDAVGEAILKDTACRSLRDSVAAPGWILGELQAKRAPADCMRVYDQAVTRWSAVLFPQGS